MTSDGSLQSNAAAVSVTITPLNDAPVAHSQSLFVLEDTNKSIALAATDIDGDDLVFSLESTPSHGTLSGTPPYVTYTPELNYNGADSFAFRAFDGTAYSAVATISLNLTPSMWTTTGPEGGHVHTIAIDPKLRQSFMPARMQVSSRARTAGRSGRQAV